MGEEFASCDWSTEPVTRRDNRSGERNLWWHRACSLALQSTWPLLDCLPDYYSRELRVPHQLHYSPYGTSQLHGVPYKLNQHTSLVMILPLISNLHHSEQAFTLRGTNRASMSIHMRKGQVLSRKLPICSFSRRLFEVRSRCRLLFPPCLNGHFPRHVASLGTILPSPIHNHVSFREGSSLPSLPWRARASSLSEW